jgi:hypothetical protein
MEKSFHTKSQLLPSGKLSHNYGKSPMFHGKNGKTHIQMAIFNSYVKLPEGMFTLNVGSPNQLDGVPVRFHAGCWLE